MARLLWSRLGILLGVLTLRPDFTLPLWCHLFLSILVISRVGPLVTLDVLHKLVYVNLHRRLCSFQRGLFGTTRRTSRDVRWLKLTLSLDLLMSLVHHRADFRKLRGLLRLLSHNFLRREDELVLQISLRRDRHFSIILRRLDLHLGMWCYLG